MTALDYMEQKICLFRWYLEDAEVADIKQKEWSVIKCNLIKYTYWLRPIVIEMKKHCISKIDFIKKHLYF